jgi:hypothetical protein
MITDIYSIYSSGIRSADKIFKASNTTKPIFDSEIQKSQQNSRSLNLVSEVKLFEEMSKMKAIHC